jgi:SPP1 gp7 family putative phage head morphogenesis protein
MKAVKVMKNSSYWKKRFEILEESAVKKGADYYESLDKEYRKAQKAIDAKINVWYQRFANNNEISLSEARRLLNSDELEEFKWSVEEYIKYGKENAFTEEWMKELENASAKVHISRLESIKLQMQQEIEKLYGNQLDGIDKLARDIYTDNYYHTAFEIQKGFNVGWSLHSIDSRRLEKVISKPWTADGKTFSDKLWTQKNELISTLHTELTQGIMRGLAPDKAIKTISDKFKVAKSKAGRLVMTESAYFASASQKDCFNELDVERFEIVATLDSHTSELCQSLDGKVQDMKDFEPGVTAPPFHPWCRTTTVPYFDDDFGERAARDADGNTYYVPSNMKYGEWKETFVEGNADDLMSAPNSDVDLSLTKPIKHSLEEYAELEAYADNKGIYIHNVDRFDGDSQILKEQIDVINDIKTEYGLTDRLNIAFEDFDSNELAFTHNGKTIIFNRCALRDRNMTNAFLNSDNQLSSTDIRGIAAHEMGHVLSRKFGNKGLDISKKVYYNMYGEIPSNDIITNYLFENVSRYSVKIDEAYSSRPFKPKYMKEIIPEIYGKNLTNPDEFTIEFIDFLKGVWKI